MKKIMQSKEGRTRVVTINDQPSKTQQQFKDQVDINNIMKKFRNTGEITHLNRKAGVYLDSTTLPSYQDALQAVINAHDAFSTLSSDIRKRFQNDPAEMIKFLDDPKNNEEAVKLGLKEFKQQKPIAEPKNENPKTKTKTATSKNIELEQDSE